ncbi:hypothetical protein [Thalassobius sp. Cn5-15]|uniref:hypothetical protein n=1 Tax=Thalassobius sp. Cn5-15 TaxID=2917763 RepID=UPI001EF2BA2C|nr:hypothetical protein [Thalassobius sp. Cn5-15]MCG7494913.1 hypothetical protein [Thalassobius sp. Cn5-15]
MLLRTCLFLLSFIPLATLVLPPVPQAQAEGFFTMKDREDFLLQMSGKYISQTGLWMRFDDLGQVKGRVWGRPLLGNWEWRDGQLCKRVFYGTIDQGETCGIVRSSGATLYIVPDKGRGERERYSIGMD